MRLHDLRQIAISRAIAAGVDVALVAHRTGHENAAITLSLYTHASEERRREAAQTVNLFGPSSKLPTMPGAAFPRRKVINHYGDEILKVYGSAEFTAP
jgi:hypothetical protein